MEDSEDSEDIADIAINDGETIKSSISTEYHEYRGFYVWKEKK